MAFPTTLIEKKNDAYVWFANAVASESAGTANHAQRMVLAKKCASLNPDFDAYVTIDFLSQGFGDTTTQADVRNRFSGLAANLIALGFGV